MPRGRDCESRQDQAARLRRLRTLLSISQRELATQFGVASGAIAQWESGAFSVPGPVVRLLEMYEQELGVTASEPSREVEFPRLQRPSKSLADAVAKAIFGPYVPAPGLGAITRHVRESALRQLVKVLGERKGLTMKVGQIVSACEFLLPDGEHAILAAVEKTARPMSPSSVARIIDCELGRTPSELFSAWSTQPIAVASIGQVHRAQLRSGHEVAVKVQHPRIVDVLRADLESMAWLGRIMSGVVRAQEPDVFYEEFRARILDECDYRLEAAHQERLRARFERWDDLTISRVHEAYSTGKVLTTDWANGDPLETFSASASQAERDRAGRALWRFTYASFLVHGEYHADAHPGNFRFDGKRVAVLDFGRIKRSSDAYVAQVRDLFRGVMERDREAVVRAILAMGIVPDPGRMDFDFAYRALTMLHRPWLTDEPFTYTAQFVQRVWNLFTFDSRNKFAVNYTSDMVFLSQLHAVHAMLARMQASIPCRPEMLAWLYPNGERPAPFSDSELASLAI